MNMEATEKRQGLRSMGSGIKLGSYESTVHQLDIGEFSSPTSEEITRFINVRHEEAIG